MRNSCVATLRKKSKMIVVPICCWTIKGIGLHVEIMRCICTSFLRNSIHEITKRNKKRLEAEGFEAEGTV